MANNILKAFSVDQSSHIDKLRADLRGLMDKTAKRQTIQALLEIEQANKELFDDQVEFDGTRDTELVEAIARSAEAGRALLEARAKLDATARCTSAMVKDDGKLFEEGSDGLTIDTLVSGSMRGVGAMASQEMGLPTVSRIADTLSKEAKRSSKLLKQRMKMDDDGDDSSDDGEDDLEGQAMGGGAGKSLECCITKARFVDPVFSSVCGHQFSKQGVLGLFNASPTINCPVAGCKKTFGKKDLYKDDILAARLEAEQRAGGGGGKASKAAKKRK